MRLFECAKELGLSPGIKSWNGFLRVLDRRAQYDLVVAQFEKLKWTEITPDLLTYDTCIRLVLDR